MDARNDERTSRAELIFVFSLLLVAAVTVTATVLHERGIWFAPGTAEIVYRALWAALWLPGIAMTVVLLRRRRRIGLAVGLALQAAAVGLYWIRVDFLALSGVLGLLGLSLRWLVHPPGETRWRQLLRLLFVLTILVIGGSADSWPSAVPIVGLLWIPYAAALWPQFDNAIQETMRQDEQRRRNSTAYRWLHRVPTAIFIVALAILFTALAYVALLALRGILK